MSSGFTDLIIMRAMLSSELSVHLWLLEHGPRTDPPVEHSHPCHLPMSHTWLPTDEADILPSRAAPQGYDPVSRHSAHDRKSGFEGRLPRDTGVPEHT
jgi:hypothetical protein